MPTTLSRVFIYPRLFSLHNLPPDAGLPLPEGAEVADKSVAGKDRIVLPPVINLSIERLQCDGVFLLDDSLTLYMWVGRSAPTELLTSLFGIPTMEGVDCKQVRAGMSRSPASNRALTSLSCVLQVQLLAPHDDASRRVASILSAVREERLPFQNLVIMREGDPVEGRFFWKLVEDRASFSGGSYSYAEYLGQISRLSLAGGNGR